ncbi:HAD-IC family P-type ATPase [Clostridium sp. WILCCON 0269]|uniref:HAD-IC family P-type ATPase n=1 Tax=Candidatus Clostridium eludens TaxID=3381663 RepID=A0ABW8SQ22_9CLOT
MPNNRSNIKKPNDQILYKRIRIPVKSVYRNENMSKNITNFIMSIKGVVEAKANPITGKVLIIFDENIVSESYIEKQITIYIRKSNIKHNANVIQINRIDGEMSESIAFEDIRAPLPGKNSSTDNSTMWHAVDKRQIENILKTNFQSGLTNKAVKEKIKELGLNVLSEKKKSSLISKFIKSLNDFSAKLLLGVSAISFFLGQIPDAIAILGIVLIETLIGTAQQYKAEKSLYSLKDMLVHKAKVLRNGEEIYINAKHLVSGDIILLEAGDKIPADARIIECNDLKTTEASLTGESTSVVKSIDICNKYMELGNRHNMLFMGTDVICGRGKAVVVATGMNTEIGKIQAMLQNIKSEATPLQLKIQNFTAKLTKICLISCAVIGFGSLLAGRSLAQVLAATVSFSIGALPESLPAIVTVSMALGVQRMSKHNAIVRNLNSIETLGSTNVICCDKTGTLTMNEMTVKRIYADECLYDVTGSGYNPKGEINLIEGAPTKKASLEKLLTAGVVCNNASLVNKENKWTIEGDPTEGSLITAAHKLDLDEHVIKEANERLREIPFDSSRRFMTVMVKSPDGKIAYCKGSLDCVIEKCKTIYDDGVERLLTSTDKEKLLSVCDEMCENALRVLAFAYKKVDNKSSGDIDNNFVFLGLVGMEDPPREGVEECIQKCHNAGIRVVMITGDHKNTAAAIGRELGLLTDGLVISGNELEDMTDEKLDSKIQKIQIFARTSPEQKHRIVKAFKRFGYIVAMAGDGVNDAPAIKEANVGIAMGSNGSDVAKDVASITLMDDDFCTIVRAIEEGRTVNNNIKNSMRYLLAGSIGEVIAIALASTIGGILPLISLQILWINVISESILGSTLATEPSSEEVMDNPPVKRYEPLIDRKLGSQIVRRGIGIGLTTFAIFEGSMLLGAGLNKARTLAFSSLVCSQLANVYDCRRNKSTLPNRYTSIAAASSIAMLLGTIYLPFLNPYFGTQALTLIDWGAVAGVTMLSRI